MWNSQLDFDKLKKKVVKPELSSRTEERMCPN